MYLVPNRYISVRWIDTVDVSTLMQLCVICRQYLIALMTKVVNFTIGRWSMFPQFTISIALPWISFYWGNVIPSLYMLDTYNQRSFANLQTPDQVISNQGDWWNMVFSLLVVHKRTVNTYRRLIRRVTSHCAKIMSHSMAVTFSGCPVMSHTLVCDTQYGLSLISRRLVVADPILSFARGCH